MSISEDYIPKIICLPYRLYDVDHQGAWFHACATYSRYVATLMKVFNSGGFLERKQRSSTEKYGGTQGAAAARLVHVKLLVQMVSFCHRISQT